MDFGIPSAGRTRLRGGAFFGSGSDFGIQSEGCFALGGGAFIFGSDNVSLVKDKISLRSVPMDFDLALGGSAALALSAAIFGVAENCVDHEEPSGPGLGTLDEAADCTTGVGIVTCSR